MTPPRPVKDPRARIPVRPGGKAPGRPAAAPRATRRASLRRKKAIRPWWYGFLVSVVLMTVLAACAVGVFLAYIYSLSPPDPLEYYSPEEVSRVYDRSGKNVIGEFRGQNGEQRILARLKDIPPRLRNAYLAVEDHRFYDHPGVDILGIARALFRRAMGGRLEGGSTLTQQLARNVGLTGFEKTYKRKMNEALLAIWIEMHYTKDQILEFYLNQVPEGGQVYGVKMAAERYFSKDLKDLSIAECAMLAGLPKDPSKLNPLKANPNNDAIIKRRNEVLMRMREVGGITEKEYQQAKAQSLVISPGKVQAAATGSPYPYFVNSLETDIKKYYREELEQLDATLNGKKQTLAQRSKKAGDKDDDSAAAVTPAMHALQTAGLRITSTIDPKIQEACEQILHDGLIKLEKTWQSKKEARQAYENKHWDGKLRPGDAKAGVKLMEIVRVNDDGVMVRLGRYHGTIPKPEVLPFYDQDTALKNGKLLDVRVTSVDEDSGEIKGAFADDRPMQGSIVVLDAHNGEVLAMAGGSGFRSEESGWLNQAMSNSRLMGSTFKPFIYAAALDSGYSPNDVIIDEAVAYGGGAAPYVPKNYERDGDRSRYFGPNTLIEALMHSRNVTTVRLFEALRIPKALEAIRKFDALYPGQPQWRIDPYYPSALGTADSSPFALAAAYQVFANLGIGARPKFFTTLVDSQGHIPFPLRKQDSEREVIKPITAYQMQYMMRQVVVQVEAGATGREVGKAFPSPPNPPICGKTGTTNDCRDAWFAGYTPDLVIVSQIGFDPPRSMAPGMTGGTTVIPEIWIPAVKEIFKTRREWKMAFDRPEDPIDFANICAKTGKLAGDACEAEGHAIFRNVPFAKGKAPKAYCDGRIQVPLIAPMPGGSYGDFAGLSPVRSIAHSAWGGASSSSDDDSDSPE